MLLQLVSASSLPVFWSGDSGLFQKMGYSTPYHTKVKTRIAELSCSQDGWAFTLHVQCAHMRFWLPPSVVACVLVRTGFSPHLHLYSALTTCDPVTKNAWLIPRVNRSLIYDMEYITVKSFTIQDVLHTILSFSTSIGCRFWWFDHSGGVPEHSEPEGRHEETTDFRLCALHWRPLWQRPGALPAAQQ